MLIDADDVKEFIKDNLLIVIDLDDKTGQGNSVSIGLRFSGDEHVFCTESIYIPNEI